ncbi:hypothetical protein CAPTEDRAFT_204689 [Capitella teleta]|uniref:Uncharacterized protein n=1 Tax=Capitella teleta TaxID=283909 RepID=R7UZY8_CAPTE|nr:hypothetical protein CAPTEDRAFT_204689 [Capitella teleta]|eukprot:ELU12143.1 hypothetical protein CAPTEDRAFT_204689 [Capitella teleta]
MLRCEVLHQVQADRKRDDVGARMRNSIMLNLTVVVCIISLTVFQVCARPYDTQLSEKDRQEIMHYAASILKIAFGQGYLPTQEKRNSGMLDAVINMPDLFKAGRK